MEIHSNFTPTGMYQATTGVGEAAELRGNGYPTESQVAGTDTQNSGEIMEQGV